MLAIVAQTESFSRATTPPALPAVYCSTLLPDTPGSSTTEKLEPVPAGVRSQLSEVPFWKSSQNQSDVEQPESVEADEDEDEAEDDGALLALLAELLVTLELALEEAGAPVPLLPPPPPPPPPQAVRKASRKRIAALAGCLSRNCMVSSGDACFSGAVA
ncbi:hypothetical protein GCM10025770_37970 [Viridibacterium curvum]|uniref:Uncharacterized protein n=1 Tax=Viridibacterium curvum TaxID=1101404 RepID=A0ABP9R6T9_9RHOO